MRRLLLACALALVVAVVSALLQPPHWAFDAGVFHAFLAALLIVAALAVNSVLARRQGAGGTGPFGPGLLSVARTFWLTMAVNIGIGLLILQVDAGGGGTDSYAMGAGALIPYGVGLLALLVSLAFLLIRWWPVRLLLATVSGASAAFACMALTWWW